MLFENLQHRTKGNEGTNETAIERENDRDEIDRITKQNNRINNKTNKQEIVTRSEEMIPDGSVILAISC